MTAVVAAAAVKDVDMNIPRDMIECIGEALSPRDLASLMTTSKAMYETLVAVRNKKRAEFLIEVRRDVESVVRALKCQVFRAMTAHLGEIPWLESGEFPTLELGEYTGRAIALALTTQGNARWDPEYDEDGCGHVCMTARVGGIALEFNIAVGTTWTYEIHPVPCWLGAGIKSVVAWDVDGRTLAAWHGPDPYFRTTPVLMPPTTREYIDNPVSGANALWQDPDGLLMPAPGTWLDAPEFDGRHVRAVKRLDEIRCIDECLRPWAAAKPTAAETTAAKTTAVDVVRMALDAWEASAIVALERYRSRANNEEWLMTRYATEIPDWVDVPFPDEDIADAFYAAIDAADADADPDPDADADDPDPERGWTHNENVVEGCMSVRTFDAGSAGAGSGSAGAGSGSTGVGSGSTGAGSGVGTVVVTYFPWENTRYLEYSSGSPGNGIRAKFEMNGAGISVTTDPPADPPADAMDTEKHADTHNNPVIASFIDAFMSSGFQVYRT